MRYDGEKATIVLSVRELCRVALLSGNLDLRMGGRPSPESAAIGAKVHRKLQEEAGAMYNAEVPFTHTTLHRGICYEVSGRADGIIRSGG